MISFKEQEKFFKKWGTQEEQKRASSLKTKYRTYNLFMKDIAFPIATVGYFVGFPIGFLVAAIQSHKENKKLDIGVGRGRHHQYTPMEVFLDNYHFKIVDNIFGTSAYLREKYENFIYFKYSELQSSIDENKKNGLSEKHTALFEKCALQDFYEEDIAVFDKFFKLPTEAFEKKNEKKLKEHLNEIKQILKNKAANHVSSRKISLIDEILTAIVEKCTIEKINLADKKEKEKQSAKNLKAQNKKVSKMVDRSLDL